MREGITHTKPPDGENGDEDDAISSILNRHVTIKNCYISLILSRRNMHFLTESYSELVSYAKLLNFMA
jgi:hypothetical protein